MGDLEPGASSDISGHGNAIHGGITQSLDDHWVLIQLNTFTNWVKDQLTNHEVTVDDLRLDFCDGTRLCALMEMLQHRRIPHVVKKPINQHQCLDNINLALKAMTNDGIKLVNIGAEDIHSGNLKLILGMVWRLILRYQIGRGKTPPKKLMLAWINAVVPGQSVTNFNTDWNDGIALHGVVEYCRPGTFPKWNELSRRDGLQNCQSAMEAAKMQFGIPMVLRPENLSNRDLDELSGMTYLSYFMKVNSPGYNATLKWVQQQIPHMNVKNFQKDWNDGRVLVALVESLGGVIVGGVEHGTSVDFLQRAMNAAKALGVDPVISAKEMSDPDVDHLGVMAYAARLQALTPKKILTEKIPPPPLPKAVNHSAPVPPPPPPPPPKEPVKEHGLPPAERLKVITPGQPAYANRRCSFALESQDNQINKGQIRASVTGPSTRPPVTLKWQGQLGVCEFVPQESGIHKVFVYNEENLVKGCPLVINVLTDVSQMQLISPAASASVGRPVSFKINGGGAHKAAVHAHGRSPSGRRSSVEVVERDGAYVANFTPTETGEWQISILCEDQHVQGSPFNIQVSDPNLVRVSGIEKGIVGKSTNFLVQTSEAGMGQLTVDITHNGRPVQSQIIPEGHGTYRVHFSPVGVGTYVIRIYFAGMETEGSPFTMEVVDAGSVVATGEGLASAEVNHRSTFFLNLGHNGSANDVKAHVISPRGSTFPATIVESQNGNLVLAYLPTEVGEHHIEVFYCGKPIRGSPFHANVYDWSKINVVNLPGKGSVRKPVEFEIDASQAGSGNLEITVNNGSVPCIVQKQDGQRFLASFIPQDPIPHIIRMKFNDRDVPGSPWKINIHNPANISISSSSIEFIPVGKLAEFEVRVSGGSSNVDLGVNVSSPSHRLIQANVINMRNGSYRVEFVPIEVGNHSINVLNDGTSVHGMPLVSKVYNTSAIAVTPVNAGIVGLPVEFSIDVSQAGEGHLEIMINRGTVPNVVQMVTKGIYRVSFTPLEPRPHTIDIRFNKEPLPQGTIMVPIMDAGRTAVARGSDEMNVVPSNRQSFLQLRNTQSLLEKDLNVRVTSPSGELVPAKIIMQGDGDYKVEYSSKFTGRHTVEILHNGEAIMGSPFYVEIYDPNKIRVEGSRTGEVGEQMEVDVICREAGKAKLKVNITGPRGNSVSFDMHSTPAGEHVTYVPREPGVHEITITYGGLDVPGCPIRQDIVNTCLIVAEGDGLSRGIEDQLATFCVDSKGQRGDLVVQVDGPNSISKCNIETEIGRYTVNYVPVEVGVFNIKITWNGREIEGSPFHPRVINPRKVLPVGGWESILSGRNRFSVKPNETNCLEFDTRQAGPGQLSAEVIGPGGKIPVEILPKERGKIAVSFVPKTEGEYQVKLNWNGLELDRSPIYGTCLYSSSSPSNPVLRSALATNAHQSASHQVNHVSIANTRTTQNLSNDGHHPAVNLDKVVLTGMGLQHARVNQQAEFFINGAQAGPGLPSVRLTGLKGDLLVNCVPVSENKYRCTYTAPVSGAYLLYIAWSDRQVSGSPYKVTVQPSSDASKVICSAEGLMNSGMIGRDIKATLDVRRAGPGEPVVQCNGPTKADYCQLIDNYDGTFTLVVRPQEPGRHVLEIKYGSEHIQGSPFILNVAAISDASKVRIHGPGIMDGILAVYQSHFVVDTHGAGAGELTVKIRGPRGGFRVEMQRQSQKDRTIFCRYDPTEVGEYLIDIRWSGEIVPGSPFVANIFDSQEELRRFQAEVAQQGFHSHYHPVTSGPWLDEFD